MFALGKHYTYISTTKEERGVVMQTRGKVNEKILQGIKRQTLLRVLQIAGQFLPSES